MIDVANGDVPKPLVSGSLSMLPFAYRLLSCPFYLIHFDPSVVQIRNLYSWRMDHCLNPFDLPILARRCVEAFSNGINRYHNEKMKEQKNAATKTI